MQIGLFGGTFDPIHTAHIELSKLILKKYSLDKVIFIPSGNSYFKTGVTDKYERLNMVKLAVEKYDSFDVSDMEVIRSGNSYTYQTIEEFKSIYKNDTLYWIMGSDTFLQLEKWRNYTYLLENINFIVYMRPGDLIENVQSFINKFNSKFGTIVNLIEEDSFMISSTEIREHFYEFEFNHSMIPKEINDFIIEHNLYR